MRKIKKGQAVLLLEAEHSYLVQAEKRSLHIQGGVIELETLIGKPFGSIIKTHKGAELAAVEPTTNDLIVKGIKRMPATIHFKDIGLILGMTGLSKNAKVLEAGTGTGQAPLHSQEMLKRFIHLR
jgi:tRNA (adenine57-N1/adenine58-N1)-methyltransferase catalytic subunit